MWRLVLKSRKRFGVILALLLLSFSTNHLAGFEVNVARDFGFDPIESTSYLQAAFNSGASRVIVPNVGQDWVVSPLQFRSNQEVVFEAGTTVSAKLGAFPSTRSSLFTAHGVSNLSLSGYGATFRMQKDEYTSGEWRHALSLLSVSDVTVKGLTFADSGGDGIYVGDAGSATLANFSQNVLIEDTISQNNRRQGISVISAKNLTIRNVVLNNTNGTAPAAGIDFEPDSAAHRLESINIDGLTISGNHGNGIIIYPWDLGATSPPISIDISNVRIQDSGHHGIAIAGSRNGDLRGHVTVRNATVTDVGGAGIFVYDRSAEEFAIAFEKVVLTDTHQGYPDDFAGPKINDPAPIVYYMRKGHPAEVVGGIRFEDVTVNDHALRPYFVYEDHRDDSASFEQITGNFVVRNPYGLISPEVSISADATWQWTPFVRQGFEAREGFQKGSALGQQDWYRPSNFAVGSSEIVGANEIGGSPASQILKITASGDTRIARSLGPDPIDTPLAVSVELAYGQIGNELALSGMYITDNDNAFSGVIFGFRKHDDVVHFAYRNGQTFLDLPTAIPAQEDTFYRFLATIDPASATFTLLVTDLNGKVLGSITDVSARFGVRQYQYVTLNVFGGTVGDILYVNNLLIAPAPIPVPEPRGLSSLGISVPLVAFWRRRQKRRP